MANVTTLTRCTVCLGDATGRPWRLRGLMVCDACAIVYLCGGEVQTRIDGGEAS